MDHSEAIRLQAAEKYVLGELPGKVRDEYEEHFFDCAECALDVKAAAVFVDNSREVLCQEASNEVATARESAGGSWFRWLRPLVAVPAFAVLLMVVGYQNLVTIPRAKQEAMEGAAQLVTSTFSLQMANVRGGEGVKVQVHPNEAFALDFDFTPTRPFDNYVGQLQDEAGRPVLQVRVPRSIANKEAHLVVPGGLVHPGKYTLVFGGAPGAGGQGSGMEVLRLSFSVEFLH